MENLWDWSYFVITERVVGYVGETWKYSTALFGGGGRLENLQIPSFNTLLYVMCVNDLNKSLYDPMKLHCPPTKRLKNDHAFSILRNNIIIVSNVEG